MNSQKAEADLRALREPISVLHKEEREIHDQPRSRAEVGEAVDRLFADLEAKADREIDRQLRVMAGGERPDFFSITAFAVNSQVTVDLAPALGAALLGDQLKRRILSRLGSVPEGFAPEYRAARLEEIESELWTLGTQEEALIEAMEAAGIDVCRRPDCDPRIVLALPEDLATEQAEDALAA